MSVRFVIGRAGTGKTHHCLQAIRDRLSADPVDGSRLLLLVPEQAGLQMERALVATSGADERREGRSRGTRAVHRAEVLSFRRLAHRVLETTGMMERAALSEAARSMVLRHLLGTHAAELRYYARVRNFRGLFDRLDATVAELMEELVEPADLDRAVIAGGLDPSQSAKLHDLRVIYAAYLDYLAEGRVDPTRYLHHARDRLTECPWLTEAELWVDGFASFSAQETSALVALAKSCASVEVTAMFPASLSETAPGASQGGQDGQLFLRTHKTYWELRRRFSAAGIKVEAPMLLDSPPPRFRKAPVLGELERILFRAGPIAGVKEPRADPSIEPLTDEIELAVLPTRRLECEYAVARICRWTQEPKTQYRYRDTALVCRDLAPYHDLLAEALRARGIPFFMDQRRPMGHHPLVELLRGAALLITENGSLESARLMLKTGLLPHSNDAADELENYLLAHGLSGWDSWQRGDWKILNRNGRPDDRGEPGPADVARLARINDARRMFLAAAGPWLEFAGAATSRTGAEWSSALGHWLARLAVEERLGEWSRRAEERGELDLAEQHRQVWQDIASFLDDLGQAFSNTPLTAEELGDCLESGLAGLTLALAPPMIDQVLVGSIDRSRHPDIKAAVLLGFNDGVFPQTIREDSILNDDDRRVLAESGLSLRPPARERVLDERLLAYTALTRASERLLITYSAEVDGKAARPSGYAGALRDACPGLQTTVISDPSVTRETWPILSRRDLILRLTLEFRNRPSREADDLAIRGRWNALYDALHDRLRDDPAYRAAVRSLEEPREARLSRESVQRLYPGGLKSSISRLESYAACPFQYFAKFVLRLEERDEAALAPRDIGSVQHRVLEDFIRGVTGESEGLGGISDPALALRLRESFDRSIPPEPASQPPGHSRDAYQLRRTLESLNAVLRSQRALARRGTTKPHAVELPFGFDEKGSLPELPLTTPSGGRVLLRGYIDRVDLAESEGGWVGVVVDYKRTMNKRLDLSEVFHGLSLQLPAYLLVLAELGRGPGNRPIHPVAGLYVSLIPKYERVAHPSEWDAAAAAFPPAHRPRGLILADAFSVLDCDHEDGWSRAFTFFRKKADGSMGHVDSSDGAEAAQFDAVLAHTKRMLGNLADGILEGRMPVHPFRLGTRCPCTWCPMDSVCRFEFGMNPVRFLEPLKRSEVFKRLTT